MTSSRDFLPVKARLEAFITLGKTLRQLPKDEIDDWCDRARQHNGWFDPETVQSAVEGVAQLLEAPKLQEWHSRYPLPSAENPRKVGVVMAGNLPLVGAHDLIMTLLSGHILQAKLSSQDPFLMKAVVQKLVAIEPRFEAWVTFPEQLKEANAYIATGSDNSARYFEYYFAKHPHIIRKNRTSVGVLDGKETEEALANLGKDVLLYYGLGCRNVSKIYVPEGYDFISLLDLWQGRISDAVINHKFMNNYDYQKANYLVNQVPHLDAGGLLLKEENTALVSPVSVLYYQAYREMAEVSQQLDQNASKIQCVVGASAPVARPISFGKAQFPAIDDFADGVDTFAFLLKLHQEK